MRIFLVCFFKQKTAYEVRISDWSSDVCSSDLLQFSRAEFAARVDKTKRAMEKRGIDVLIVSDPSNMAWLTGYDGWSFYVHQAVVLPIDEDPVWFGRSQDGNGARRTVWMAADRIESYADHYVQSTERHPM